MWDDEVLTDYRLKFYQLLERLYNKEEKYDQDFYQKKKKKGKAMPLNII